MRTHQYSRQHHPERVASNIPLKQLCFVHTPKAAGNSFKKLLRGLPKEIQQRIYQKGPGFHSHGRASRDGRGTFSIVRNPFDWLISMWHYNWPGRGKHAHSVQNTWASLEAFLYEFNSHEKSRSRHWNVLDSYMYPLFSHRHLQTCQTFDLLDMPGEKHSYADFYVRLELLSEAVPLLGMGDRKVPRENKSSHSDYRRYYSTRLIDHITSHRHQELELLGYDFEGPTDNLPIFKVSGPFIW